MQKYYRLEKLEYVIDRTLEPIADSVYEGEIGESTKKLEEKLEQKIMGSLIRKS